MSDFGAAVARGNMEQRSFPDPGGALGFVARRLSKESVMESRVQRLRVGPYRLVQQLEPGRMAERWLALNEESESTHLAHRFRTGIGRFEQRKLIEGIEKLAPLSHPHILPIEKFTLGHDGSAWIVTPYTGNLEGLVTLANLREEKGGQMSPSETERALVQLLEAAEYAHASGFHHGPLIAEEIMVDRRGSLSVELYGLGRLLTGPALAPAVEVTRDEVRSIVEIGYWLLTGLSADEPRIRADRLMPRLDHRWDEWFNEGLDPMAGFMTAGDALAALPSMRREVELRPGAVRTVLGRFRRVLGAS